MALIQCPECGREVSDQAPACIHCGYPLTQDREERYALVLIDSTFDYPKTVQQIQEQLHADSEAQAQELASSAPVVLKRGSSYDACVSLAAHFRPYCKVKMVRDQDPGAEEAQLLEREPISLPEPEEERHGLGFGGTVAAVILGVVAAILLLSIL